MRKVKFGIIGLGSIARTHAEAISLTDNAELVSAYHKDQSKADAFASDFGGRGYSDLDAFFNSGIDAVAITTPSGIRAEYAVPALKKGIHTLLEKPMAVDSCSAYKMIEASKESGAKIGVIFQNRFSPLNLEIRKAIDSGRLGKRVLSSYYMKWFRSQEYYDSAPWRGTKAVDGGGCLMNQGIHGLDLLLSFSAPLKSVFAFSNTLDHVRIDVEDVLCSSLSFSDGSLGTFEVSTASWPGCSRRIELTGTDGTIIAEDDHLLMWSFKNMNEKDNEIIKKFSSGPVNSASSPAVPVDNHKAEYKDFVDAIISDREPLINASEGLKSLLAVEAIYKSAESGTLVNL